MNTDEKVMFACVIAFMVFVSLGLTGSLPGQCEGKRADTLVCLGKVK